jgi:O-antigen/teichoic acid export membrane protein
VRDNALGEVAVQLTRVGGVVYLARHLEPADFGLYRILLVISAVAALTNEAGIPEALIQRKLLHADHEATGWWISLTIGLLTSTMLFFGAPLIAGALLMPRLAAQVRLLVLPLVLVTISTTGNARLRRSFQFGAIALADTIAELVFVVCAIFLQAFCHLPRWSLAGGLSARFCVQASIVLLASRYIPRQLPRRKAASELASFAFPVWAGGAIVTLSANADYLMIGRILGSTVLGYYSIAWYLLRFIPDRLYKVAGRVTLPLFSQMQDDNNALRKHYCDFVESISRLLFPIMTGLAVAAPVVVQALYGVRWEPAAVPLRVLALGLILVGMTIAIGPIYCAKGRPVIDLYVHSVHLVLIVVTLFFVAPMGLVPASIAMSAIEGAIAISGQMIANWLIGQRLSELCKAVVPGLRNAVLAALATEIGCAIASGMNVPTAASLIVVGALPALMMAWLELPRVIRQYR